MCETCSKLFLWNSFHLVEVIITVKQGYFDQRGYFDRSWFLQKLLLSEQDNCAWLLKDTDRENEPLNFNSSAYKKYEHGDLGSWYIKATLCKKFQYWKKIFKKMK